MWTAVWTDEQLLSPCEDNQTKKYHCLEHVTLQFNTLSDLVAYQIAAHKQGYRIVVTQTTIEGVFTEEEITLATNRYRATVVAVTTIPEAATV